jgi:ubiquinol-cytochrome c reductase iron-sulfur subunit
MSTQTDVDFDVNDPTLTRFDLVREGARRDGVEIVHYAPRFPVPGTRAERRIERTIAFLFLLSGLLGLCFVIAYIWWPWRYESGANINKLYNPVLGITLGAIQERHNQADLGERALTGATLLNMVDETGVKRRPLLAGALALGAAPLGLAAAAPLIGGLIKSPKHVLFETAWKPAPDGSLIRMTRDDGSLVRPEEVSVGGQMTVFPDVPGGTTNEHADSPVLLIHLREEDAATLRANLKHVPVNAANGGGMWGNYVAYSKICTHAGCPASLYEQQTNRLLCPCHQSQFQITDNARPVFGPATRRLPMLPLGVEDGVFVAKSDFRVPIGPGFWERP